MFKTPRKKYDLIFSIGAACSCTETLRASDLQKVSYPFDWLYGNNFSGRIDILLSEFDRFIEKEDLVFVTDFNNSTHNPCVVYENKYNGIGFNHDFKQGVAFDEMYPVVKEKYNRRKTRLLKKIKKSKNILIAYIQIPSDTSKIEDVSLINALEKLEIKYPKKNFNIIYLMCDASMETETQKVEIINDKITKITGNYKSISEDVPAHVPNTRMLINIFQNRYYLKTSFLFKITNAILKFFINLIPNRTLRQNLRKNFIYRISC